MSSTPDMANCWFCHNNWRKEDWSAGDSHDFRISDGALYYYDAEFGWEGMEVNFCPICGRGLREGEENKND